jgi:hypothetical protein
MSRDEARGVGACGERGVVDVERLPPGSGSI